MSAPFDKVWKELVKKAGVLNNAFCADPDDIESTSQSGRTDWSSVDDEELDYDLGSQEVYGGRRIYCEVRPAQHGETWDVFFNLGAETEFDDEDFGKEFISYLMKEWKVFTVKLDRACRSFGKASDGHPKMDLEFVSPKFDTDNVGVYTQVEAHLRIVFHE